MKYFTLATLLLTSGLAQAKSFNELEGRYKVKVLVFSSEIDLTASGHATLIYGHLKCEGEASIQGSIISAPFECNDGRSTTIEINLQNVSEYSKFKAPVTFVKSGTFKGTFTKLQ